MKTFQEFLEEGKKKEVQKIIKRVTKEVEKQDPHQAPVLNFGKPKPGKTASPAEIEAMMQMNSNYVKELKRRQNP